MTERVKNRRLYAMTAHVLDLGSSCVVMLRYNWLATRKVAIVIAGGRPEDLNGDRCPL